jgi:protein-tyrosine phosphatase
MERFRILFVCAGNICRSPLAEGIFAHLAAQAARAQEFEVDSAGTGGWHQGDPPDRRSIAVAGRHSLNISGQRARKIRPSDFDAFDLILAMDRDNLKELRKTAPASAPVHLFCGFTFGTEEDIPDPYYGGAEGFETVYAKLFAGCSRLLDIAGTERASRSGNTSSVR